MRPVEGDCPPATLGHAHGHRVHHSVVEWLTCVAPPGVFADLIFFSAEQTLRVLPHGEVCWEQRANVQHVTASNRFLFTLSLSLSIFLPRSPSLSLPPSLLLSLAHSWALVFFTFCPAESHRSGQLPCSAQWTSSFEIFHFTLRCQAPRRWVTEVWPKYSRGLKELYLTALRHLFREKQLFSAVLVCHFRTGSWPPASRCFEEQHLWSHEGDPETCPGLHRALQWRWSGHTTAA